MHALAILALLVAASGSQGATCRTTRGSDTHPPAAVLARAAATGVGFHGNGTIWTQVWPDDTVTFRKNGPGRVEADGSLGMKFFWLLATDGPLSVSGRRLDASEPPLRAELPSGFIGAGYQPSGLIFSSAGCWEVTARANGSVFTFVTRVVKTF